MCLKISEMAPWSNENKCSQDTLENDNEKERLLWSMCRNQLNFPEYRNSSKTGSRLVLYLQSCYFLT